MLGGADDVRRFVRIAAERLNAPLQPLKGDADRLPVAYLPPPLRERMGAMGIGDVFKMTVSQPAPAGITHVHRTHPLIAALADYVAERALEEEAPDLAARSGAMFTHAVTERTTLLLLRLRTQLTIEMIERGGKVASSRDLLSEECVTLASSSGRVRVLDEAEAATLIAAEPPRNMVPEQRRRQIERALAELSALEGAITAIAEQRAPDAARPPANATPSSPACRSMSSASTS